MLLILRSLAVAALPIAFLFGSGMANAQSPAPSGTLPDPPSTFVGSITDAAGDVPAGVAIEAYVGNNLCGESTTQYTGEGNARVTVYVVDVVSESQTDGCGKDGATVRIRVGDRISPKFTGWQAGLVRFDIVFGENVTPKPIPTATPTPTTIATATTAASATAVGTVTGQANGTPSPSKTATRSATPGRTATGVTSSTPAPPSSGDGGGGGFPVWGTVLLALIGLGLVGAGAGIYISRQSAGSVS
jgi:hypothetical protein